MHWQGLLLLSIAILVGAVHSMSLDPEASKDLENCIKQDECVISLKHIRPRRKLHISIEALFVIDFPKLKRKMSFFLDRKQQRITLDISNSGNTESKHFALPEIDEMTTIRSLALQFHQSGISLWVDCKEATSHQLDMSISKLYKEMDEPVVKLFRERKYPLHFDETMDQALQRGSCQKEEGGTSRRANRRMLKSQISEKEKGKKREARGWFNQEPGIHAPAATSQPEVERGDIPIMHDCEDALSRSMTDLLALIKLLREDIARQRDEIAYLRNLLENCAGCKPQSANLVEISCRTANPCYHSVECFDSSTGPRCGRCPVGMIGDGKICKAGVTCADRPCYIGVQCRDTLNGYQCDSCPIGYEGDGRSCKLRSTSILMPSHNIQHYQRQYRKYSVVTS